MAPKVKARSIRRKKRKFTGNRYTRTTNSPGSESSATAKKAKNREDSMSEASSGEDCKQTPSSAKHPSALVKKLGEQCDFSDSSIEDVTESIEGFRFVDISILASVFQLFWCPVCKYGHVVLEEDKGAKKGFASLLVVKCTSHKCSFSKQFYTSSKLEQGKAFEVNRRVVLAARNIGVGHQGLLKFSAVMNMMAPMHQNSYSDHVKAICNAAQNVAKRSMENAVEELKEFYEPEEDGFYNVGISADGTWRKRGFSSSFGVVTALSLLTGKAVDVEVMSKECRECMGWREKQGTVEFNEWWEGHQATCHANFEGSSGAMDAAGALAICQRSVDNYGLRYVEFLGDGDNKSYKVLVDEAVYGDVEVTKLECVGHVQKRLGSRLRSLKKRTGQARLADGKGIGGRGRLTDKTIDSMQVYYGKAIRGNTHDIESMEKAVMAIWHHSRSTDDDPDHDLCPAGETSWCGYQRDKAKGTADYSHQHPLPEAVADAILPVFESLSDRELLRRCLHGGTQNQNGNIFGYQSFQ